MLANLRLLCVSLLLLGFAVSTGAQNRNILPPVQTPTDVEPGSITCDECPYPYPSKYLDISVYSQDVRISYMDVAPMVAPNGHTVMLMHGNNFGGFYFKAIIDGLTAVGFRVIVVCIFSFMANNFHGDTLLSASPKKSMHPWK